MASESTSQQRKQ